MHTCYMFLLTAYKYVSPLPFAGMAYRQVKQCMVSVNQVQYLRYISI